MSEVSNVVHLRLPKTAAQAEWMKKLSRRRRWVNIEVTILPDPDRFREHRTWRILFGLYQDCTSIPSSKGFGKKPSIPFTGRLPPSKLPLFLREAMPFVADRRAEVRIEGDRLRRRLLDVMAV